MVYFRLRLPMEVLKEINALIIERAERQNREVDKEREEGSGKKTDAEPKDPPANSGSLLMDATCKIGRAHV